MWTIAIALIIGLIVGGCLYGKNFWDKRINVLGISAALMLVSLVTTSFVFRPSLQLTDRVIARHYVNPMWLSVKTQDTAGFIMVKDSSFKITDYKPKALVARGIQIDSTKTAAGTLIKKSFKKEVRVHYLLYLNSERDTMIGCVREKNGKLEVSYWEVESDLKIVPIPTTDTISKPRVESIRIRYEEKTRWVVSAFIPAWGDYTCFYIPQSEYDALPKHIKRTCSLKSRADYLNQLASN